MQRVFRFKKTCLCSTISRSKNYVSEVERWYKDCGFYEKGNLFVFKRKMPETMSIDCHSTVPSGCSSLESLDLAIQPEMIRLSPMDGTLTVHAHNDDTPKHVNDANELMKVNKNKTLTNWVGYYRGGEKISKMTNVTYATSSPKCYYNATPSSTLATTMPIWVKHYKK